LRKLGSLALACPLFLLLCFAHAQEIDVAAGGSTLFSTKSNSASQSGVAPPEKGGTYPSASVQAVFKNHFGLNVETAFRYHRGLYNGYQSYRPVLYDVNGVFTSRVSPRIRADFMVGFGGETAVFYNQSTTCNLATCPTIISNNHFLLHAGAGVPYHLLGRLFIRPEAHYYHIVGNTEFHSGDILRLGASIGLVFGK